MHEDLGYAAALHGALQTGLLASLLEAPRTAVDHARALSLDLRATERVLDVLVAFGVARREQDSYRATPKLEDFVRDAPGGLPQVAGMWLHVPTFLRTGDQFIKVDADREGLYANVVAALGRMFADTAASLASRFDANPPAQILDIGCGSGVWSLALAQRFRDARVTGLDLPAVLEVFRARASDLGVADRIASLPGDVHQVEIPRAFDLVMIANVLRIEAQERARAIVKRARQALVPGGRLVIVDAFTGGTEARERVRAVYALNLAMRTARGRVYTPAEVSAWLEAEGVRDIELAELEGPRVTPTAALLGRVA
jgi:ubiquinone/menaquinone biosynthesis C-methylase UbiE